MTREEIFKECVEKIAKTNCLLLQAATGTGKSKLAIDNINRLINQSKYDSHKVINILLLVDRDVHKITWTNELDKWGGIKHKNLKTNIVKECYASLHKHCTEHWDVILADECHHLSSDLKRELLKTITFDYFIGLSATIPRKLQQFFKFRYHAEVVSCDVVEAIDSGILPEPQILLYPLTLDNRNPCYTWEINAKVKGQTYHGSINEIWKYKKLKVHAILTCTEKQKAIEYNKLIEWEKNKFMQTRNEGIHQSWLFHAGKRLEFLSDIKLPIIKDIARHLSNQRAIIFCRSVSQATEVSKNCIHYQNKDSKQIYEDFNAKKLNQISAVNILNENANLVDCKYAVFCNFSSSEVVIPQRLGRSMRHKAPVIVFPYYTGTREEEIVKDYIKDFNKDFIKVIHSIKEIV